MPIPVVLLCAVGFIFAACTATGPNPEPLTGLAYERTSRLLEMRAGLQEKNSAYEAQMDDRLKRNTNKRNMGELKDEYANWDRRAQAQIERELLKRYQSGDASAYYLGIERYLAPEALPPPQAKP